MPFLIIKNDDEQVVVDDLATVKFEPEDVASVVKIPDGFDPSIRQCICCRVQKVPMIKENGVYICIRCNHQNHMEKINKRLR